MVLKELKVLNWHWEILCWSGREEAIFVIFKRERERVDWFWFSKKVRFWWVPRYRPSLLWFHFNHLIGPFPFFILWFANHILLPKGASEEDLEVTKGNLDSYFGSPFFLFLRSLLPRLDALLLSPESSRERKLRRELLFDIEGTSTFTNGLNLIGWLGEWEGIWFLVDFKKGFTG